MEPELLDHIKKSFCKKPVEELLVIWRENDRDEWSDETFLVIKDILQKNKILLPVQKKYRPGIKNRIAIFNFKSPGRWFLIFVHLAAGFFSGALGLSSNPGIYSVLLFLIAGLMLFISLHLILGMRKKGIRMASAFLIVLLFVHEAIMLLYASDHQLLGYITFFSILLVINEAVLYYRLKKSKDFF